MIAFKFEPLLKSTIWGGNKIIPLKHLDSKMQNVGESWEISGVKDNETVVAEDTHKGKRLNALVEELGEKLLGRDNYSRFGNEFPLLIKFIDARQPLSIQVHPTDEIARRQGKSRGKTEMWYVMDSDKDATLLSGLKKSITPDEYKAMVADNTICDAIAQYSVKEGDCFFLPAGRIHAIGAGCLLAEIQQTSDVTYRIYDYNRRDKDGNLRELHTKEAAESIDYTVENDYRTNYPAKKNQGARLVSCPYFTTSVYDIDQPVTLDYSSLDSFVILIALEGSATLTDENGGQTSLNAGETVLLPATASSVRVEGCVKFLESYI